jgi:hypothetical protein
MRLFFSLPDPNGQQCQSERRQQSPEVKFFRGPPKQRDRCRIFNRFIACVQIAQPARRQKYSGLLFGLKQTERGNPKKNEQKYSLGNGARDSGDGQAQRPRQSRCS